MSNSKQSAGQIAQAGADVALNALSQHDDRIDEVEAKLEAAKLNNKNAVRGTTDLDEAKRIKAETTAEVAALTDVRDDLIEERVGLFDDLKLAYEGIGQAKFDIAEQKFKDGMVIAAKGLKAAEPGIAMMAEAYKVLSAQQPFSLLDEAPTQFVRILLLASGKTPKLPNRRHLNSYEEIVAFYGTSQGSQHSLKIAKHDAKTGKWALMDRVSDGFRAGRAAYLKAKAKRAA